LRHNSAVNQLRMDLRQSIITLSRNGWSQRRIARELGINRETVAKYPREARESKPAIVPSGSTGLGPEPAILPAGSELGRNSRCEPLRTVIVAAWEAGLSAQRIYQDLVTEHQFCGTYDSVKRFVRGLGAAEPLPFRRMESEPGTKRRSTLVKERGCWRTASADGRTCCGWS
jgi:transposase